MRVLLLFILLLAASGARGQRLYLPDGNVGGGVAGTFARASGESAAGVFLVVSPIEKLDLTFGIVQAPDSGSEPTTFAGGASYFFQSDGDARVSATLGFQTLQDTDFFVVTLGATVAQRIEAGPGLLVVPQGGATFGTVTTGFDPVVVISGGVGFSSALGNPSAPTGLLLHTTPLISYSLDAGRIGLGGTIGGSVRF